MLENQLARYSLAQFDVMTSVTHAVQSEVSVQPRTNTSTCVLYDVSFY